MTDHPQGTPVETAADPANGLQPEDRTGPATEPQPEDGTGPGTGTTPENRALAALRATGVPFTVTRHDPVSSLEEAAAARGLAPGRLLKTIVVRRGADDYLFVLVPGGRQISWPRLRRLLGVSRLSLPDKDVARDVTGYERGTITPFGSLRPWPVVADARLPGAGPVSIGAGAHGVAATLDADTLVDVLAAEVADVTDPTP